MSQRPHDPHCIFCKIVHGADPVRQDTRDGRRRRLPRHQSGQSRPHVARAQGAPRPSERPARGVSPRRSARSCPGCAGPSGAATGADGLNVIVNNGQAAGQTIDHCHWHIIPRFHDDPVNWPWPHTPLRRRRARPDEIPHRARIRSSARRARLTYQRACSQRRPMSLSFRIVVRKS